MGCKQATTDVPQATRKESSCLMRVMYLVITGVHFAQHIGTCSVFLQTLNLLSLFVQGEEKK